MLTRDQILSLKASLPTEEVQVPEWGGSVFVRTLTAAERDRFETLFTRGKQANFRALIVAFTACDADGKSLFAEEDAAAIGAMPVKPVQRIFDVAMRLNAITDADVDELEKN
jgi:hypothetical protein